MRNLSQSYGVSPGIITCHPTQVNMPHSPVLNLHALEGWKAELILVVVGDDGDRDVSAIHRHSRIHV